MPNVIAVVGPFRSGTSCVAGILHTLGVSMGRYFPPSAPANQKGFYEAVNLRKICTQMYPDITAETLSSPMDFNTRVALLQQHIDFRKNDSDPLGVKHPALCLMVPEMAEAWPGVKVVSVSRDIESVIESMGQPRLFPRLTVEQRRMIVERMVNTRDEAITSQGIATIRLQYNDVLSNPAETVSNLIAFCGINPAQDKIDAAVAFVDSNLCHHEVTNG